MSLEINNNFLEKLAKFIDDEIVSADYRIGSTTRPINIRRSIIDGSVIKKHVYLTTQDPIGVVNRVRLFDKEGNVVVTFTEDVEHKKNRGRLFEFTFKNTLSAQEEVR